MASNLTSSAGTDGDEDEDNQSKTAPIRSDPAPDYTLTNSEPAKVEPHAFKPESDGKKDAKENDKNADGKQGEDRVHGVGEESNQHEAMVENVNKTLPPIPLKLENPEDVTLAKILKKMNDSFAGFHVSNSMMREDLRTLKKLQD